jgi:hypothetical protein
MDINIEDVNNLLHFAKKWYRENPGTQIPVDTWDKMVDAVEETRIPWGVYDGNRGVERVTGRLIPALAGISLGVSTEALHGILHHHGALVEDLCVSTFVTIHDAPKPKKPSAFAAWNTTQALIRAFCLNKEQIQTFMAGAHAVYWSPEIYLAFLTVPNPDMWPVTSIREHLKIDTEGSGHKAMEMTSVNPFRSNEIDLSQFTDAQVLALLDRSGNLCPGATSEKGFERNFFCDLFRSVDAHPNLQRILAVINAIEKPALIEKMRERIFENVTNSAGSPGTQGLFVLMGMMRLDHAKYGELLNRIVLTLNLMPYNIINQGATITDSLAPCYLDGINKRQDKVLERLQNELMVVPPESFRMQHFRALGRFSNDLKHPQDLSGVDLQSMLIHCVDAMGVYWQTTHIDRQGEACGSNTITALEYTEAFIAYALKHFEPEADKFAHLSPLCQRILADNGMNVRKLPGLTRKDRGEILCEQMGL